MNGTWTAIAIGTCILACIAMCIILYKLGYTDGWDARGDHEHDRQARRQLASTRAAGGIRAKTGPAMNGHPPWDATFSVARSRTALILPGIPAAALTATAPLAHRRASDTGEIRMLTAATDLYVTRLQADGDAYRQEMYA